MMKNELYSLCYKMDGIFQWYDKYKEKAKYSIFFFEK